MAAPSRSLPSVPPQRLARVECAAQSCRTLPVRDGCCVLDVDMPLPTEPGAGYRPWVDAASRSVGEVQ